MRTYMPRDKKCYSYQRKMLKIGLNGLIYCSDGTSQHCTCSVRDLGVRYASQQISIAAGQNMRAQTRC